jgi:peroxiredoxin|tara:strand:- start:100 stop:954 length:855 start_codon:yes stop_codon:yes gene_type:complete
MLLKSLFIGGYPVIAFAVLILPFVADASLPYWLVVFSVIAASVFPFFLGNLFLYRTARTSKNLNFLFVVPIIMITLSVAGIAIESVSIGQLLYPVITMSTALVGNLLYVFWYSRFGRANNTLLEVGKTLPEFSLKDAFGNVVTSKEMGSQASLIMFYRGNWCPLCMAQIKEVAGQYRELENRGIKIYMVSPQSEGNTKGLAKRFDVNMNFLIDEDNKAADNLKIKAENGLPMGLQALGYDSDTVMPTVIMTNKEGKIIFADLTDNYRVRPEPEDFLRVFDAQTA